MTPLEIEILLNYHYRDDEPPNADSPAQKEALDNFVHAGILGRRDDGTHWANQRALKLYIDAICAVPLPVRVWQLPDNQNTK
jgi:hypothetical protein